MPQTSRILLPLFVFLAAVTATSEANRDSMPSHHTKRGFQNTNVQWDYKGAWHVLKSRFFSGEWQGYDKKRDIVATAKPALAAPTSSNVTVTWIGHATVLIQHQGINVLTDPIFSKFASPFSFAGPARISQPALTPETLPKIHAVVISHDHYDHLDTASIRTLGDTPTYYVPLGIKRWMVGKGISADRVVEMDWWDSATLSVDGKDVVITATPSQHFSGRGLHDRNHTLWASWSIVWPDYHAWFGGDTGYNEIDFAEIGRHFGDIDFAIIPIGAYKPRDIMGPIHVNPAEAVLIHRDLKARHSMAIHWGAFRLAAEGVLTPAADLASALQAAGISDNEFGTFAIGETRRYPTRELPEL